MTLKDICDLTGDYAKAHEALSDAVRKLTTQLDAIKRQHMGRIKRLTATAATRKATLHTAIDSSPNLFTKPRTVIFDGIKVGLKKQPGKVQFDDGDKVIARIKKIYGDESELIRTTEEPDIATIKKLTVGELAKIGCTLTADGDKVVIDPILGDVDEIVAALLKDATDDNIIAATEAA